MGKRATRPADARTARLTRRYKKDYRAYAYSRGNEPQVEQGLVVLGKHVYISTLCTVSLLPGCNELTEMVMSLDASRRDLEVELTKQQEKTGMTNI
jgi:hypothetical protein